MREGGHTQTHRAGQRRLLPVGGVGIHHPALCQPRLVKAERTACACQCASSRFTSCVSFCPCPSPPSLTSISSSECTLASNSVFTVSWLGGMGTSLPSTRPFTLPHRRGIPGGSEAPCQGQQSSNKDVCKCTVQRRASACLQEAAHIRTGARTASTRSTG